MIWMIRKVNVQKISSIESVLDTIRKIQKISPIEIVSFTFDILPRATND